MSTNLTPTAEDIKLIRKAITMPNLGWGSFSTFINELNQELSDNLLLNRSITINSIEGEPNSFLLKIKHHYSNPGDKPKKNSVKISGETLINIANELRTIQQEYDNFVKFLGNIVDLKSIKESNDLFSLDSSGQYWKIFCDSNFDKDTFPEKLSKALGLKPEDIKIEPYDQGYNKDFRGIIKRVPDIIYHIYVSRQVVKDKLSPEDFSSKADKKSDAEKPSSFKPI